MAPPMLGLHQPPGFMHQAEQGMAPSGATLDEMEALFAEQQAQMRQQQAGILPPAGHPSAAAAAGLANGPAALGAMLHSFVGSARTQSAFQAGLHALPLGPSLSVADKVRIRDRATIMARHMFADMGQAAAEQQVGSLLASLAINPGELPAETNRHVQDVGWHDIWAGAAKAQHLPQPSVAADLAAAAAQAWSHGALPGPTAASGWAQECSDGLKAKAPQPSSWADEFAAAGPPAATSDSWAAEFGAATASAAVSASGRVVGADAGDARASSARVVQALGDDPKMARSQFFQVRGRTQGGDAGVATGGAAVALTR